MPTLFQKDHAYWTDLGCIFFRTLGKTCTLGAPPLKALLGLGPLRPAAHAPGIKTEMTPLPASQKTGYIGSGKLPNHVALWQKRL
jgi:hypothetical protein